MEKRLLVSRLDSEHGIGLILVLLFVLTISVLAAGIVFTAQSEIFASYNYRIDVQSLYLANAGLGRAVTWFNNSYTPHTPATDYSLAASPVKLASNNQAVILDGISGSYNYPDSSTQTSFQSSLVNQTLTTPSTPPLAGSFSVKATLNGAKTITLLGSGPTLLESWLITSQGKVAGGTAQASAKVTRLIKVLPNYAALACASGPASLTIGDSSSGVIAGTDSYDSSLGPYGGSNVGSQGHVATNGQYVQDGGVVKGSATYASTTGSGTITGTQTVTPSAYDCSTIPLPTTSPGTTNVTIDSGMSPYTLDPAVAPYGNYGNVLCTSACDLTLKPGTYNMNALEVDSGSKIHITGPTVVNIVGTGATPSGKALYLDSNTVANTAMIPSNFMIFVNRTEDVVADSGTSAAYVLIAPKSLVVNDSNTSIYGQIIAKRLVQDSGAQIHYDLALQRFALSLTSLTVVSWSRSAF